MTKPYIGPLEWETYNGGGKINLNLSHSCLKKAGDNAMYPC